MLPRYLQEHTGRAQNLRDTVPGIQVRVYHPHDIPFDKTPPPFHPKAWLFQRRDGKGALLIAQKEALLNLARM